MPEFLFIINPTADRGGALKRWQRAEAYLKAQRVDYDLIFTRGSGHALAAAEEAARSRKYRVIVAGGGDGTSNEVVNGLCRVAGEAPTLPLGVLPIGSANDLAHVLRIPRDPEEAARYLVEHAREGRIRMLDAGRVHSPDVVGPTAPYRYFLNNCGIGFEAQVGWETRRIRRLRGFLIYLVAVFRSLEHYQQPHVHVRWDGKERAERMLLVTIGNGRRAGGGFWLTPYARPDDGLLDVGFARALSRLGILRLLPKAINGKHVDDPAFSLDTFQTLEVRTDIPVLVHTDGEIVIEGTRELRVDVVPGKVQFVCDPNAPLAEV